MDTIVQDLLTLGMLVMLQAVLGFDNLLYISLESKNAPPEKRAYARKVGIGLAIILRILLLFVLLQVIDYFQDPLFKLDIPYIHGSFNLYSLIVILGGGFIIYTAVKEIWHMISLEEHESTEEKKSKPVGQVIAMIILMNLVFSFDSILSAIALTKVIWVMATAIVISGILMIWLAGKISDFLQKNRMYEVLGLFILFLVGVMLISEGGHIAHMELFGSEVTPMSKGTFYFILVILVVIDVVQGRYQKKLIQEKQKAIKNKL